MSYQIGDIVRVKDIIRYLSVNVNIGPRDNFKITGITYFGANLISLKEGFRVLIELPVLEPMLRYGHIFKCVKAVIGDTGRCQCGEKSSLIFIFDDESSVSLCSEHAPGPSEVIKPQDEQYIFLPFKESLL